MRLAFIIISLACTLAACSSESGEATPSGRDVGPLDADTLEADPAAADTVDADTGDAGAADTGDADTGDDADPVDAGPDAPSGDVGFDAATPGLAPLPVVDRTTDAIVIVEGRTESLGGATYEIDFYRNNAYGCGLSGNYTFMVVNPMNGTGDDVAPLWVYLHGGGTGYFDEGGNYVAVNDQTADTWNHEESLTDLVETLTTRTLNESQVEDNTLTRRIREGYRLAVVSMCDHDQYAGLGTPYPNNPNPDAQVNGLQATMAAVDFAARSYPTTHVFAHGTSAGSVGVYSLALSYSAEGQALTGVVADSVMSPRGSRLQEAYAGHPDFPQQAGFDPAAVSEKIGFYRNPESGADPETRIQAGFELTPLLFVGGLADPQCGWGLPLLPEAEADGLESNCAWGAAGLSEVIDAASGSPHQVALFEGEGHVPTIKPSASHDVVDAFLEGILATNPPHPFASDPTGDDRAPEVLLTSGYEVEVTTHTYGQGLTHDGWLGEPVGTVDLLLDVYEPTDAPLGRPAAVIIHGGSFLGGSRRNANIAGFARYFAERGFVAMSIDYRVAGDFGTVPQSWFDLIDGEDLPSDQADQGLAMYPAARDAKAALRWLHAHADSYGINPNYVTTIGGSAGSYLAIMLGVTDPEDFRDELSPEDDSTLETTHLDAASDVHTIIDHWGGITHMELLELLDGRSRFDPTDAPVSIVHGTDDPTVLFEEAEKLRSAYMETGVPYAFHSVEGGRHGIWGATIDGVTLQELALAFVIAQQGIATVP